MNYQEAITYLLKKVHEAQDDTFLEAVRTIQQSRIVVRAPATPVDLSKPWGRKATDILMAAMRLGIPNIHVHFALDAESIFELSRELGITCDVECVSNPSAPVPSTSPMQWDEERFSALVRAVSIMASTSVDFAEVTKALARAKNIP